MPDLKLLKKIDMFGRRVNLRFNGSDEFKTYCGACATIMMGLILLLIFTINVYDIAEGKIDSFNYIIRNTRKSQKRAKRFHKILGNEVLAFGFDHKLLDSGVLGYSSAYLKNGQNYISGPKNGKSEPGRGVYQCTDYVYSNLSPQFEKIVPKDFRIFCLNVTTEELKSGVSPVVYFSECNPTTKTSSTDPESPKKACKPKALRNQILEDFEIWAFTLADASDFTSSKTKLTNKFAADSISCSNLYKKRSKMMLREADIKITHGVFISEIKRQVTNMFLRNEEQLVSIKPQKHFLELRLEMDKISEVLITKKYKSLSNILAFIGGFSKGISILLMLFVFPVREVIYYKRLINAMFNVCLNEHQLDLAYKMLSVGHANDEMDNFEEADQNDLMQLRSSGIDKKRKKYLIEKLRAKQNLRKIKKIEELIKGKRSANAGDRGLMGELASNLTADKIMENMMTELKKDTSPMKKNFADLIFKGMNLKGRKTRMFEKRR